MLGGNGGDLSGDRLALDCVQRCVDTGLGWCASVIFYQAMRFERAPTTAALWIGACLTIVIAAMAALRRVGRRVAHTRDKDVALDASQALQH
jgi:hypothetical protein